MNGEEWRQVGVGDLVEIKHGFAFKGADFTNEPATDVLVTPGNFRIGGGWQSGRGKYHQGPVDDAFVLNSGDLVVTMTDLSKDGETLGYPALVPASEEHRYLHNQRIGRVQLKPGAPIEQRFLYYILCGAPYRHWVLASATGSTVRHTSPSRIYDFRFDLPPLPEQRAIAEVLGALDDKIELNERMNATLDEMARALFKSWFVDFDPVRAKAEGRQPSQMDAATAALFPGSFEDSPLGPIPAGWRVGAVGDVAEVIDCLHSKKPSRVDDGGLLLQLWNIQDDGLINREDPYWIDETDYRRWSSRIEARAGDCVITNVGRVGAVAQMPHGLVAALGRNMTAIHPVSDFPYPTFLISALLSRSMQDEIAFWTDAGSVMDSLNVRSIPRLRFTIPPEGILQVFETMTRPLRALMEANLAESATLTELRDTLLPKLISGELRVGEVEREVEAVV
jgi:type I restriction enzyme, S subunit